MSAIITNNFRRQSCQRFIQDILTENTNYYIGLGKSEQWLDDEALYPVPLPDGSIIESQDIKDNLLALVKLKSQDILMPKNPWQSGRTYKVYDPTDPMLFDLESYNHDSNGSHHCPSVVTYNDKVYVCLANNDNGAVTNAPSGVNYGIEETVDDYVWAYIQDVSPLSPFYSEEFVPVAQDPVDPAPAKTATSGIVYNFCVRNGGSGILQSVSLLLKGIDENGATIAPVELKDDNVFNVNIVGGTITSIEYNNIITNKLSGYKKATIEAYSGVTRLLDVDIKPMIVKIDGFGSNPINELPAFYTGCYAKFQGKVDGEAVTDVPFRQISLIKNPERLSVTPDDEGVLYEDAEALDALTYIQTTEGAVTHIIESGSIIEQTNTGARAFLDKTDISRDRIYYHRNSSVEVNYIPFNDSDNITIYPSDGSSSQVFSSVVIDTVEASEYIRDSGEVVFVDQRAKITRNMDQTEDIKIVIQF